MNGFSAADMTDARAKGYQDRVEHEKEAAAQDAGEWSKTKPTAEGAYYVRGFNLFQLAQYEALVQVRTHHFDGEPAPELVCNIHESTSNADMEDWSPIVEMSEDFEWLGPLVAAPVAAAPVDLDAHGLRALDLCVRDLRRLIELSDDFALDEMQIQSLLTAIESMELRKVASTPATPGIDLEQFRKAVMVYRNFSRSNESEANRLLALIDASPKGGSDDAWRSMDAAPKSAADGNRVEGVYLLGFIPDDDLVDPQACIDVIWWEPLLPNSKGERGKWCANRYSEACEVAPTKWQHLPNVQASSAEVGS